MTTTIPAGASLSFAQSLFTRGTDVFGPREIKTVFDLDVPDQPIPFSEEELKAARKLDQVLVLQVQGVTMKQINTLRKNKTSDGKKLYYDTRWYAKEPFYYTTDSLLGCWQLVSREVLPTSTSQNYLEQTDAIVIHLKEAVFTDEVSAEAQAAIDEFEAQRAVLTTLLSSDSEKAAERLANLKVNQLFRQSPAEVLWLLTLYEAINHERLLPNWTWTNKRSTNGGLVVVGNFDEDGVDVAYDDPRRSDSGLGVCFSRSGKRG